MQAVQAWGVAHSLDPTHPEWFARLDRAVGAFHAEEVDAIIATGGRYFCDGKEVYNNPLLMRNYLLEQGVPATKIFWRPIADSEVETDRNPQDTADEVSVILSLIQENELQNATGRPITNEIHWKRVKKIYRARAHKLGLELRLEPLLIPSMLGWQWAAMEIMLSRPYTVLDPGWTGPIAERMREARRQGDSKLGVAGGGSSGKT